MDKVALVTGGSRGIGKAITNKLTREGYKVVFTYNQNEKKARALIQELSSLGLDCDAYQLNLGEPERIDSLYKKVIAAYGSVDILVNNAGMADEKDFLYITAKDWDKMLKVNLQGPFFLAQHCIPGMRLKNWGRIINITSIGGQWGGSRQVHYASSKAGLINLTHSIANLYSKDGITSNSIAVGLVKTEMTESELKSQDGIKKLDRIPVGRLGSANEVADIVRFLCEEDSGYITGQTINYNGGMLYS